MICDVSFSCVCAVIYHKFCHNIVKGSVDRRGDGRPSGSTGLFDNVMTGIRFLVTGQMREKLTSICFVFLFFYSNKLSALARS